MKLSAEDSAAHPFLIEIKPEDISPYRHGNTGVNFLWSFDSGHAGPHIMVMALTHGNEICGAACIKKFLDLGVRSFAGKLSFCFANHMAYEYVDPSTPFDWRYVDEDMNRIWSKDVLSSNRQSAELTRARELLPIIEDVDFLLDIHSLHDVSPSLVFSGALAKGRELALSLDAPRYIVSDEGHASGCRLRDYGGFGDVESKKNALVVECGFHWAAGSVDVAIDTAARFIDHFNIVDHDLLSEMMLEPSSDAQMVVHVTHPHTLKSEKFTWVEEYTGMELIRDEGSLLGWDGDEEVRTPYDNCVLILPNRRNDPAQSAVRFGKLI